MKKKRGPGIPVLMRTTERSRSQSYSIPVTPGPGQLHGSWNCAALE